MATFRGRRPRSRRRGRAGSDGCPCPVTAHTSGRDSGRISPASSTRPVGSSRPPTTTSSQRTTRRRSCSRVADARFDRITRLLQMLQPGRKYALRGPRADAARRLLAARGRRRVAVQRMDVRRSGRRVRAGRHRRMGCRLHQGQPRGSTLRNVANRGARGGIGNAAPRLRATVMLARANARPRIERSGDGAGCTPARFRTPSLRPSICRRSSAPAGAGTVAADGASYREIMDVSNWDRSVTINTPGQSGQPGSPYYDNLLPIWSRNAYFPMAFSEQAVSANAAHTLILKAKK